MTGRLATIAGLFLVTLGTFAQTANRSSSVSSRVIWEPPAWGLPDVLPKATVPKQMLATLRVSNFLINLEDTRMNDVLKTLGGTFGGRGDAGESDQWLCFHGQDRGGGWVLWLESGEINGGTVGSFQWHRLNNGVLFDPRCKLLGGAKVEIPIESRLGMATADVLRSLGPPTVNQADRLIYVHEHELTIRAEPFTSFNVVMIDLRGGRVSAIKVSKTTSS